MGLKTPMSGTFIGDFLILFIPSECIINKKTFNVFNKESRNKNKSKDEDFLIPNVLQFKRKTYKDNILFRTSLYLRRNFPHKKYPASHLFFDVVAINTTNLHKNNKEKILKKIKEMIDIERKDPEEIKAFLILFCNGLNFQSERFTRRKITEANIFLKKINENLRIDENFNLKLFVRKRSISFLDNLYSNEKYFTGIVFPFVKIALLTHLREKIILDPDTANKIHESSFNTKFERFIYRWVSKRSKRRFITFILGALVIFLLSLALFKIMPYILFFITHNYIWKRIININEIVQQNYYAFQQFCKASDLNRIIYNVGFKYLLSVIIVLIPIFYVSRFINSFKKDELKIIDKILFCKSDEIYKSSQYRDMGRAIYIEKSKNNKNPEYKYMWTSLKEAMYCYQESLDQKIFGKISLRDKTKEKFLQVFIERYMTGEEDSFLHISRRL